MNIEALVIVDGLESVDKLCWFQNELYILPKTASVKGFFKLNSEDDEFLLITGGSDSIRWRAVVHVNG